MITDDRAERAFEYLRDTVGLIGESRGRLERAEIMRKRTRKKAFIETDCKTKTIAAREAEAETAQAVIEADDEYIAAVTEYETLKARRDIESIALDVWRTESANRRRA